MSIVPVEGERFEFMEEVAALKMRGESDTSIAKKLNKPRSQVVAVWKDYKTALANDSLAHEMARDHLNTMTKHYDELIRKYYDLLEELDGEAFSHQIAAQKNSAIKNIAELEAKRLDALTKAGLLEGADLGAELAEMEERQEMLIDILRNDLCPSCRANVASKLQKVTQQVEVVEVYE